MTTINATESTQRHQIQKEKKGNFQSKQRINNETHMRSEKLISDLKVKATTVTETNRNQWRVTVKFSPSSSNSASFSTIESYPAPKRAPRKRKQKGLLLLDSWIKAHAYTANGSTVQSRERGREKEGKFFFLSWESIIYEAASEDSGLKWGQRSWLFGTNFCFLCNFVRDLRVREGYCNLSSSVNT